MKAVSAFSSNIVRHVMIVCLRKSRSARSLGAPKAATCATHLACWCWASSRSCYPQQGLLTLLQAFAMSFGLGLCHLGLLCLERFDLVGHPLLRGRQRRLEVLAFALLMPVGTDDLLAAIVGLEGPMVNHAFEAVFLSLRALAVALWPLAHLDSGLELWSAPVH